VVVEFVSPYCVVILVVYVTVRRRGIVGIEAAIVMIAFVIVAAALAFVVLNMGFFTTQQSRQVIQRGLGESSSALMVDGTVVATVDVNSQRINYTYVPIKLSTGQYVVDLTPGKTIVGYWSPQRGISVANTYLMAVLTPVDTPEKLANIIKLVINNNTKDEVYINGTKGQVIYYYVNVTPQAGVCKIGDPNCHSGQYKVAIGLPDDVSNMQLNYFFGNFTGGKVITVMAWITKVNDDIVLDPGEKVLMLTYYNVSGSDDPRPQSYDNIKFEVRVPIGAPLTIERAVPASLTQGIVDLG